MPGPSGKVSTYLEKAMENLMRLQRVRMKEEYTGVNRRMTRYFSRGMEGGLRAFLEEEYKSKDPVCHIEILRNEAMSYLAVLSTDEALNEQLKNEFEEENKRNVENCVDNLFRMITRGEALETYYLMTKNRNDSKPEDLEKYAKAAYDVVTALFSIASMCPYVTPEDIIKRLAKAAVEPIAPIAETQEKREAFVLFVAQNIRAIVDMIIEKNTSEVEKQKKQADPTSSEVVAKIDQLNKRRKQLLSIAINTIKSLQLMSATSKQKFVDLKRQYAEHHDWQKMSNDMMRVVSFNLDDIEITTFAIEEYASPELFSKDYFGDALMYMFIIDGMGEVQPEDLIANATSLYYRGSQAWAAEYDPFDSTLSKDVLAEKKREYMNKGLPQFYMALISLFKMMKNHEDKKETIQSFLEISTKNNPYVSMKYYELFACSQGKQTKELYDMFAEKFKGLDAAKYEERCDMLSNMFMSLVYCADTADDKIAAMSDLVIADKDYPALKMVYASSLVDNLVKRKQAIQADQAVGDKVSKMLTDMFLKDSALCQTITIEFNEYVWEHCTADDWAANSLNNVIFKALADYRVNYVNKLGKGDKSIADMPHDFNFHASSIMTSKLINCASADEFITAVKPLTDAVDGWKDGKQGATWFLDKFKSSADETMKSILNIQNVLDNANKLNIYKTAVSDFDKARLVVDVKYQLYKMELERYIETSPGKGNFELLTIMLDANKGKPHYEELYNYIMTKENEHEEFMGTLSQRDLVAFTRAHNDKMDRKKALEKYASHHGA